MIIKKPSYNCNTCAGCYYSKKNMERSCNKSQQKTCVVENIIFKKVVKNG